jgi:hypothetical protein
MVFSPSVGVPLTFVFLVLDFDFRLAASSLDVTSERIVPFLGMTFSFRRRAALLAELP